jgi:hypothetical protein
LLPTALLPRGGSVGGDLFRRGLTIRPTRKAMVVVSDKLPSLKTFLVLDSRQTVVDHGQTSKTGLMSLIRFEKLKVV